MSYDYRLQPPTPIRPVDMMRKYFFAVLFIKSYVYNIKGQAIIFRRKTLDSLMKLLNDFDETYLHSSYEHSYQNKVLSEGNVDFLVKYTDNLDEVISLIDQNAFTIKLSWQPKRVPQPYPPMPVPPPCPGPVPPAPPASNIQKLINDAVEKAMCKNNSEHVKRIKIVRVHKDTKIVEVRQWDDVNKKFLSMQQQVNIGAYSSIMPDWRPGDDALLIDDKYLQRINDTPNYRRVKVTDVSKISTEGKIGIVDFDDVAKRSTSGQYWIDLRTYSYGEKIPAWHVNDDALLFDNKYLQKLDVPEVTEGTINIINQGDNWSNIDGSSAGDDYYYGYDSGLSGGGYYGDTGTTSPLPGGMSDEYSSSDDDASFDNWGDTGTGTNSTNCDITHSFDGTGGQSANNGNQDCGCNITNP